MQTSVRGIAFLIVHEGLAVRAYRDSVGEWTIGVGHTKYAGAPRPKAGMRMSEEAVVRLLATDLRRYERRVRRALGNREVPQHVFDALVSFDFNTGAIHKASFLPHLMRGNVAEAERRFMWYRKPKDIIPRREAELRLWREGAYGDLYSAAKWTATHAGKRRRAGKVNPLELATRILIERAGSGFATERGLVKEIQRSLKRAGYHEVGAIDGIPGPRTRAALNAWLLDRGYDPVRSVDELPRDVLAELREAPGRRPESPAREDATASDLRRAGSTDIRRADWGLAGGGALAVLGSVGEASRRIGDSLESIASPIRLFMQENGYLLMAVAGVAGIVLIWSWRSNRVRRHREGSYVSR